MIRISGGQTRKRSSAPLLKDSWQLEGTRKKTIKIVGNRKSVGFLYHLAAQQTNNQLAQLAQLVSSSSSMLDVFTQIYTRTWNPGSKVDVFSCFSVGRLRQWFQPRFLLDFSKKRVLSFTAAEVFRRHDHLIFWLQIQGTKHVPSGYLT